jgi:membrane-bound lytic murein transglycosylase D
MHIRLIKLTLLLLSVIFSANLFAGVNALGQKFEILEDLSQTDEESSSLNDMFKDSNSIWKTISTGYGLKEKKSKSIQKKIRKYEKWYSQRPEYMERMLKRSERYLYHVEN